MQREKETNTVNHSVIAFKDSTMSSSNYHLELVLQFSDSQLDPDITHCFVTKITTEIVILNKRHS